MTGPKRVTDKQLAANRRNAQKSTGPRTAEGKAVSRYNALKHGILARAVIPPALAPYESRADFDRLVEAFQDQFAPATPLEALLVQQVAVIYWRLARLYRAEAGAIAYRQDKVERDRTDAKRMETEGPFALLADVDPEPHHPDAPREVHGEDVAYAQASLPFLNAALKYARYETSLLRRLNSILSRLERLQRGRGGEPVPLPLTVDVTGLDLPEDQP